MNDGQSSAGRSAHGHGDGRDLGTDHSALAGNAGSATTEHHPIVLVEDDAPVREALSTVLELDGHAVLEFDSAEALLREPVAGDARCLILDVNLPGMSGLKALETLRSTEVWTPAIVVSARATDEMRQEARRLNAAEFLTKPIDVDALLEILARIGR